MTDEQPDLFALQRQKRSRMGRPRSARAFDEPAATPATERQRALIKEHDDALRRLEPVALACGFAKEFGATFTMADVRNEAEQLAILTGNEGRPNPGTDRLETPRALAFLGGLLPGLARLGLVEKLTDDAGRTIYETSRRDRANGNKQALWRLTIAGDRLCRDYHKQAWQAAIAERRKGIADRRP